MEFLSRMLSFLDKHSGLLSAVGLILAGYGLLLTLRYLRLYHGALANLASAAHSPIAKQHGFLPPELAGRYGEASETLLSYWHQLKVELDIMPDSEEVDQIQAFIAKYDRSTDLRASAEFATDIAPVSRMVSAHAQKTFQSEGDDLRMDEPKKRLLFDWLERLNKFLALPLAVFALLWQVHTYRETHEESPMVRASISENLKERGDLYDAKPNGLVTVEITNLGPRTMHLKSVTLFAAKRTWTMLSPTAAKQTVPLEKGSSFSGKIDWDFKKYPLLERGPSLSTPEDFLVEIETTRTVHRRHVDVNSIAVTF